MADPTTQPLLPPNCITAAGKFTLPTDYNGEYLQWAGDALAVSGDGKELYMGGYSQKIFRMNIPAIGGRAVITGSMQVNTAKVAIPGVETNGTNIGGLLIHNGRMIVSAYTFYDNSNAQLYTHFAGQLGALIGPVRVNSNVKPGLVAGYMCHIPPEWQTLLGGSALTGQGCISIINRSSYGPALNVFEPSQIINGGGAVPGKMVLGFPHDQPRNFGDYSVPNQNYQGTEWIGGVGFVPGTRTVFVIWRKGTTFCYDVGSVCKDPTSDDKGPHGYPYKLEVLMYDANEFLAVVRGFKAPWNVMPYNRFDMPDTFPDVTLGSIAYDPVNKKLYTKRASHMIGANEIPPVIKVYNVTGGSAIPIDKVDAVVKWKVTLSDPVPAICDATKTQRWKETWTYDVITPASGGGVTPVQPFIAYVNKPCVPDVVVTPTGLVADVTVTATTGSSAGVNLPVGTKIKLNIQ